MEFAELAPEKNEPDGHGSVPLQSVFLHVTKACNLSCKYCYFSARTPMPDEMTTEDFDNLWPLLGSGPIKYLAGSMMD